MKVAIVYDRVNKWGGAERVLLSLKKIFPEAVLYTSVYDKDNTPWAKGFKVIPSFLQKLPFARENHELFALLMPIAFESFNFDGYDLVISVTSESAKGVLTKPGTIHICYCLTPNRYLWSGYKEYFKNSLLRFISYPAVVYLRHWDMVASSRPDHFIAISNEVKGRIKKYYNRDSKVIFPPIGNLPHDAESNKGDYFLVVSRLVPYKKVELAVKACTNLSLPLKVVGRGSEEKRLKNMAGRSIEFLGDLTDEKLSFYYKNCRALIFPGLEDFGLVIAEAQSFGKPVIAFRGGGAKDIIIEGKTGEFFDVQDTESLKRELVKFDEGKYNSKLSIENSKRFSFDIFEKELSEYISSI